MGARGGTRGLGDSCLPGLRSEERGHLLTVCFMLMVVGARIELLRGHRFDRFLSEGKALRCVRDLSGRRDSLKEIQLGREMFPANFVR